MMKKIALIGNPNCGKTTLFNRLTGSKGKIGNWSGVTVDSKEGKLIGDKNTLLIDLPGVYSLEAFTNDEKVVPNYLSSNSVDLIVNVLDVTNLERNLRLTLELLELNVPVLVVLNMADQLKKLGGKIDVKLLAEILGVSIITISARKDKNFNLLIDKINESSNKKLSENKFSKRLDERLDFINKTVNKTLTVNKNGSIITEKIDDILTNKYLCFPIFFALMYACYFLSGKLGGYLSEIVSNFFAEYSGLTSASLASFGTPEWLNKLVCALINGLGTVSEFLPQVVILYLCLGLMEECGYMSRVAFFSDKFFRKIGLSGKSVICLSLSCGCTVSGIMACKTIEDGGERDRTIILTPFMPCSGKVAVFSWFSYKFFGGNPLISLSLYALSLVSVALCGLLLKNKKSNDTVENIFLLEMPPYRVPSLRNLTVIATEKIKEFIIKAGTVVFSVSIAIWALKNFGFSGYVGDEIEKSFIFFLGDKIKYIFYPLGFGSWQIAVAILSCIMAKESAVETLSALSVPIESLFANPFSVYAFLVFVLLSPPCIASISQAKKQLFDKKNFAFMLLFQTLTAYIFALIINLVGIIFYARLGLIFVSLTVIIILIIAVAFYSVFNPTAHCKGCKKGNNDLKCKNKKLFTTICENRKVKKKTLCIRKSG